MKKRCIFFGLLLLMTFNGALCQEESGKIRVTVVPMINVEKDERLDVITQTVTDTVSLYLKLIRKYRVFVEEDSELFRDLDSLRRYALAKEVDNIIFGKASRGTGKQIIFEMSVYDRYKNSMVLTKRETSTSIFEVFDAADRLAVSLVESFSGVHLGFGVIALTNNGEEGDFTLFLDGESLVKNTLRFEKVINGIHHVEITQRRMLGERVIFEDDIEVLEDKETKVEFAIPYLLAEERAQITAREREIERDFSKREARRDVKRRFDELLYLLEDTSFCYRLKNEYDRFFKMREDWIIEASKWEIEDSFFTIGNPEYFDIFKELRDAYEATVRKEIRSGLERDANILYNTLGIHAMHQFSNRNWEKGAKLYRDIERMKKSIPCTNYYNFDQESEYVQDAYSEYQRLLGQGKKGEAERYMGEAITSYFGTRMSNTRRLFLVQPPAHGNDLIVLTNPMGMRVWIDGKYQGQSPLKIRNLKENEVKVTTRDPWFEEKESTVRIAPGTNLSLISSSWNMDFDAFGSNTPMTKTAQITGKNMYELGLKKMKNAVSYIVYIGVDNEKGHRSQYKKIIMRANRYLYSHPVKVNERYYYRVCALNENDIKSPWSNEAGFEGIPKWDFQTGGAIHSSPAIDREENVYFGSADGALYALDRDGHFKWSFQTENAIYSSPAIGRYGVIYFGSTDNYLYALNPDGSLWWKYETDGALYSSPAVDEEENIYIPSWDGHLYSVNMEGRLNWKAPIGERVSASPAIDADGVIFIGNNQGILHAFQKNGSLKWQIDTEKPGLTSPAVGSDGTIYQGSHNGAIVAVGQKGNIKWSYDTGGAITSSPVIGDDDIIYVNSGEPGSSVESDTQNNKLFALSKKGKTKWEFHTAGSPAASPALGDDGLLYIGDEKGKVVAVDSRGNAKWVYTVQYALFSSPTIARSGTLYVGSRSNRLYAFSTISKGIGSSPWPISGNNTKHTASAQTGEDEGKVPYRLITVDGDSTDWYGVKPTIVDPVSDHTDEYTGTDIEKVYLAMDSTTLYSKIDLSDESPNQRLPGYYRIGLETFDTYSLLTIYYDKGWKATIKKRIEHEGIGRYRTVAYGDVSEGDTFLEAAVPLSGLGVPLPAYLNVHSFSESEDHILDTTTLSNMYVPKQTPSEEELRKRWLLSFGAGGYYGDRMYENPSLRYFDLLVGLCYSFGGDLYWGLTLDLHPKSNSITVMYFRNYEKPYHYFDIMLIPYTAYTFGYGIGINHLSLRTKFSYYPNDDENPYCLGLYAGFLF